MKVDIAVCGRFHYHKYIKYLTDINVLNKIYFSYKRNYDFGLEQKYLKNYPFKEYLMFLNIRYLGKWRIAKNLLLYHRLWEKQVAGNDPKADILHIMIHGNSEKVIHKYKKFGKVVIGEAVNAFPSEQLDIMEQEYRKYGIQKKQTVDTYTEDKMIHEFKTCDYVLTASNFVRNSFIKNGFQEDKLLLLPYGSEIDHDFHFVKKVPQNNLKILCVGKITFRKGQIYLLEALRQLKQENINCETTFVGAIDDEYMACLKKENLDETYHYVPHISNEKMREFMSTFDLFVLPSIEDGFSVVVTEALSVGLPVITTTSNGAADVVINDKNGFRVPPSDSKELASAIRKTRGRTFEIDKEGLISWSQYADKLVEFYSAVDK